MSGKDYLDINETTQLSTMDYDVKVVVKYGDYYYIKLENEQSFVTDGKKVYDTSFYGKVCNVFIMGDRLCAVCYYSHHMKIIDLNTKEVLFDDYDANDILRVDDQVVCVFRSRATTTLYNIFNKDYLYAGNYYKYDYALENGFYIFVEENSEKDYHDLKRRVVNLNGDVIFDNIDGYPEIVDNHLIITKNDMLRIFTFNNDQSASESIITKGGNIIDKPYYDDRMIILVEKGFIKFYSLDNKLLKEIKIDGLNYVRDSEFVKDVLKLCVTPNEDEDAPASHIFLNIKTGEYISHFRIEGYPYWKPKAFVGFDDYNDIYKHFKDGVLYKTSKYHFYDLDLNEFACIDGNLLKDLDLEDLFHIQTWNGKNFDNVFVNATSKVVKKCIYDEIVFESDAAAGYAISDIEDKMDVVDLNLNVLVDNVDKKVNFDGYHIRDAYLVNDYVALILVYYGEITWFRSVLFNPEGEVIKDSNSRVFPLDNTMLLMGSSYDKTLFLNTKTGEIKPLTITAKADPNTGLIDFDAINNVRKLLPDNDLLNLDSQDGVKKRIKSIIND